MAELGLSTSSSSTESVVTAENEMMREDEHDSSEPSPKKAKMQGPVGVEHSLCLEDRLNGILCCTVCLDLPTVAVFQVYSLVLLPVHVCPSCFPR